MNFYDNICRIRNEIYKFKQFLTTELLLNYLARLYQEKF